MGAEILILSRDRTFLVAVILDLAFWTASLCLTYEICTSYTVYLNLGSGGHATTYVPANHIQRQVPSIRDIHGLLLHMTVLLAGRRDVYKNPT